MKLLKYMGISFDEWAQTEDGAYWAEICQECTEKFFGLVSNAIDDGGGAIGCCSVKGCMNNGNSEEKHYYIDFKEEFVSFEEVNKNEEQNI